MTIFPIQLIYKSLKDCNVDADVVIDFSNASAVDSLLEAAVENPH